MSSSIDTEEWIQLNSVSVCLIFNKSSSKIAEFNEKRPTFVLFKEYICPKVPRDIAKSLAKLLI